MSTGKNLKSLSLVERHSDLTRRVILGAALDVLESASMGGLTVRAVAKRARIAERTVFRYFADRDEFLDAVADAARARLALPPSPATKEQLLAAPRALYTRFEAMASLTKASLHSDLFHRIRTRVAQTRGVAVRKLVDELAPRAHERARRIAAANIRYYLAASTWHYYRYYMGLGLEDTIACAETAISQALASLSASAPPRRKAA
jgi:AcrR family transcriptional regulator